MTLSWHQGELSAEMSEGTVKNVWKPMQDYKTLQYTVNRKEMHRQTAFEWLY